MNIWLLIISVGIVSVIASLQQIVVLLREIRDLLKKDPTTSNS